MSSIVAVHRTGPGGHSGIWYSLDDRLLGPGDTVGLVLASGMVVPGRVEFNHMEPTRPIFVVSVQDPDCPVPTEARMELPPQHHAQWLEDAAADARRAAAAVKVEIERLAAQAAKVSAALDAAGGIHTARELEAMQSASDYRASLEAKVRELSAAHAAHDETRDELRAVKAEVAKLRADARSTGLPTSPKWS